MSTPTHHALELLHDSTGLLIPYHDPNGTALAEALKELLSSASLRTAMVIAHPRDRPDGLRLCLILQSNLSLMRSVFCWKAGGSIALWGRSG